MMQWDRLTLGRMAKELGFPRDTHLRHAGKGMPSGGCVEIHGIG